MAGSLTMKLTCETLSPYCGGQNIMCFYVFGCCPWALSSLDKGAAGLYTQQTITAKLRFT
tara:strand:+ start:373 stop:552 length:180 start_codon:yes stop_codon:yes gene_type:complete